MSSDSASVPVGDLPDSEDAESFAGVRDGFERLWTPHRMAYVRGERPGPDAGTGCPFCVAPDQADDESLVVHRGEHCYVVLNLFPYNPGHLLICPYRHISLYVDLTAEETTVSGTVKSLGMYSMSIAKSSRGSSPQSRYAATQ